MQILHSEKKIVFRTLCREEKYKEKCDNASVVPFLILYFDPQERKMGELPNKIVDKSTSPMYNCLGMKNPA